MSSSSSYCSVWWDGSRAPASRTEPGLDRDQSHYLGQSDASGHEADDEDDGGAGALLLADCDSANNHAEPVADNINLVKMFAFYQEIF